jgi:hypothetical protein
MADKIAAVGRRGNTKNLRSITADCDPPQNKRMKLTGAAILVSRGMKVLQAAPAAYPYRYAATGVRTYDRLRLPRL